MIIGRDSEGWRRVHPLSDRITVVHSDIGTSLSECNGDCGSDSTTAASYNGDSILQIFHGFMLEFVLCPVPSVSSPQSTVAALANGHRVPCGHGQNILAMPRRNPFGSVGADVLLRQEPDEEEDEDEGDRKEDDEDEDTDDGYSE
jgi:hypothetical protein